MNCTAAGTTSIIWRSQEYIGDPIAISDFRPLDYNVTSASVNTTVATLTRNENGILESTLLIIPTLNRLNSSVVCEHTDSGNLFTFTINVFGKYTATFLTMCNLRLINFLSTQPHDVPTQKQTLLR